MFSINGEEGEGEAGLDLTMVAPGTSTLTQLQICLSQQASMSGYRNLTRRELRSSRVAGGNLNSCGGACSDAFQIRRQ